MPAAATRHSTPPACKEWVQAGGPASDPLFEPLGRGNPAIVPYPAMAAWSPLEQVARLGLPASTPLGWPDGDSCGAGRREPLLEK